MSVEIQRLDDVEELLPLVALEEAEGFGMVSRLVQDWRTGVNRFKVGGEVLLGATADGSIVGVCGLNRDPFASAGRVGRVRRLFVVPAWRRRGVASALVQAIVDRAAPWFDVLHVRTYDQSAVAFYRSLGFVEVIDDPDCTLRRDVAAQLAFAADAGRASPARRR